MIGFVFRLVARVVGFAVKATLFVGALVVVAAGVMYALFDGEQYKQNLSRKVLDLTGRVLAIDGPAELQLGYPPRIVLNNVRIGNPRWASRADMARIRKVQIELDPLRALAGDGLAQVRIEGADVLLETSTAGTSNWEDIAIGTIAGAAVVGAGLLGQLMPNVQGPPTVVLSDSSVGIRDGATGRVQTLSLGSNAVQIATGPGVPAPVLLAGVPRPNPCDTGEPETAEEQLRQQQQPRPTRR